MAITLYLNQDKCSWLVYNPVVEYIPNMHETLCSILSISKGKKYGWGEGKGGIYSKKLYSLGFMCFSGVRGRQILHTPAQKKKKISIFALLIFSIKICLSSPPIFYFCFFSVISNLAYQ